MVHVGLCKYLTTIKDLQVHDDEVQQLYAHLLVDCGDNTPQLHSMVNNAQFTLSEHDFAIARMRITRMRITRMRIEFF